MQNDLGNEKISTLLLKLSVPAIMSMLVAAIYNIVDRIFIGRVNPLGLTAVGITMPLQVVQMAFVLLIGIGSATLISINYGRGDIEKANKILRHAFIFIIIGELFVTLTCIAFLNPIFNLLGVSKEIYSLSRDYIIWILIGGVPGLTGYCLNNTVRSIGHSKESMYIVTISSVLNIILDALFILILGWGVVGAAIATVISQTVVTIFVLSFFSIDRYNSPVSLKLSNMKIDIEIIKEIVQNGLPNFYMQVFGTIVSIILNRYIIGFGGNYHLASVTIITSISLFLTMIIYGIGQGVQPIIGYNFGAEKYDRVLDSVEMAMKVVVGIGILFLIIILFAPKLFIVLFTDQKHLIEITEHNIRIYLLGITFIGIHSVSSTFFQSIKEPKISSILYILRYGAILVPGLLIFPKFLGIDGVYFANAISDIGSGAVALILLIRFLRKFRKEMYNNM